MDTTNNRQGDDNPIVWQSGGQTSGVPGVYVYLERLERDAARSKGITAAGDRLSQFISRNVVYTASAGNYRNPYTQTLNRIWGEIVPSRLRPPTHLLEVGYKVLDTAPEPFLRVPVRLIDPTTKRLVNVQEVLSCIRAAVESFSTPNALPLPRDLKHGYTLIIFEALFVGWINERDLVEAVVSAATQPLFRLNGLTDRE